MSASMTIVLAARRRTDGLDAALSAISEALGDGRGDDADVDVDVVVVVDDDDDDPAAGATLDAPRGIRRLTVVRAGPDLGTMRNAGLAAATGDIAWLIDERGLVTRSAVDVHLRHDRRSSAVLMAPCPVRPGHVDAVDAAWWFADRDLRLGEEGFVLDPRDASFANASASTKLLRAHPFAAGLHGLGIEDLEVGMLLADAGHITAFDPAAAIGATPIEPDDEITRRVDEGEDRARFLARHPHRHRVVFRHTPGVVERWLRRLTAARIPGPLPRALQVAAASFDRAARMPVAGFAGHRLRQFASMAAIYSGVAAIASSDPVVRRSLRESLGAAIVLPGRIGRWWRETVTDRVRLWWLPLRIHHVSGPSTIERAPSDLLAITVVRNGAFYIEAFIEHHRQLGIEHFVVLDNGSSDDTLPYLRRQDDVTLLRTAVPYKVYENLMKRYLVRRYSTAMWSLFVDIDELFDYPGSDRLDLRGFLGYLDHHGHTALAAQMLDLFPPGPIAATPADVGTDIGAAFPYFDISDISKRPYEFDTDPASTLTYHRGGIRRTVFGSENGLTKAPLILLDDRIETFVAWHHVRHADFADVTGVIRHYPFNRAFHEKAEEAARSGRYGLGASHEYRAYWAVLADEPGLTLLRPTAQRYEGVDQLLELGFLQASDRYRRWVDEHGAPIERRPMSADG